MTSRKPKSPAVPPAKRWAVSVAFVVAAGVVVTAALLVDRGWLAAKPSTNSSAKPPELYEVRIGQASWQVELAVTPAQQARGLGKRDELPAGRGMLFVYDAPQVMRFWMKDCRIPLDIAFLDAEGVIVTIHTMPNEPPGTPDDQLPTYSSEVPAQFALEVPAGALGHANVRVGDRVRFDPNMPITVR